jgi:hypothetical protein
MAMEVRLLGGKKAERVRLCICAAIVWYSLPKSTMEELEIS